MTQKEKPHLPMRARVLGGKLRGMVLASASELRAGTGLSADQGKRGLQDLENHGLVARTEELGCLLPGVPRLYQTEKGLHFFEASEAQGSWHRANGVGNLIVYDLPRVEAINSIATLYPTGKWELSEIQLYEGEPMCGVAAYSQPGDPPACLLFCWISVMDTPSELHERLIALLAAMQGLSMHPDENFFPAGLCIVAADQWGAAQALVMASVVLSWWVPPTHITAWWHNGHRWQVSDAYAVLTGIPPTAVRPLLPPISGLRRAMSVRKLGRRRFDRIVGKSPWAGRAGQSLFRVLTLVGQYPVAAVGHYQALAGEKSGGGEIARRLTKLVELGLIEIVAKKGRADAHRLRAGVPLTISDRGEGQDRYALTTGGRSEFCNAHGGTPGVLARRTKLSSFHKGVWSYRHEDGVYETLAQFSELGCAVAPGWRANTVLADHRRIEPDGIVLVGTPWGRLWSYLEFELSDRSWAAVKPRCEKYASPHRLDDQPVLVVCHDDKAERNFERAGRLHTPRPRMLTTTLRRLRDAGVAGQGVWSDYGVPVTLTAPGL